MTCNPHPPGHVETTLKTAFNRLLFRASIPLVVLGAIGLVVMLVGALLPRVLSRGADRKNAPQDRHKSEYSDPDAPAPKKDN